MGIDFEAEGLLEGLEGEARDARRELLERLGAEGVGLDELRAATVDGRVLFLAAERVVGGIPRFSARQVAERADLPVEFLVAIRRAHGLPVSDADAVVFSEDDVEGARLGRAFLDAGISLERQLAVTRVIGRSLSTVAEAMRTTVLELVLEPGASEAELAERYAGAVERFMPLVGPLMEQMLRLHLRNAVRTEVISAAERARGALPGAREVAVGFADLVGFTRLGEELGPDDLERVAGRLVVLTGESLRPDVRLVKTLGDAAMLVAPDPELLLETALDVVAAADAEGADFPQVRVGAALGPAVSRAGDWYGRPVNLASRITAIARPGSVLVARELREAVDGDRFRWSSAGARSIRGVDGSVRLFRARRSEPD
ncbi:MAG TPA: adenylate cyclase regulatory domain-containing protein [Solirubrobacteraceae bacterium]|nr:adenylate cyclase regulatory domain-containing protein [Solirubrobacteraceae bacterium]